MIKKTVEPRLLHNILRGLKALCGSGTWVTISVACLYDGTYLGK